MELLRLNAENFCSIGNIELALNQPGLILIAGINKDAPKANSNGAAKSALFDAICWALWGETTRGLSGDEVVNRRVGKDCVVTVTLKDGEDIYAIVRHRKDTRVAKPNDLEIYQNGVSLASKGKIKSMQEVVNRIVGFDFPTFCAMMPGTGIKAAHMTDVQIKTLLEGLLQTEQLSAAYEQARAKHKELQLQVAKENSELTQRLSELKQTDAELEQLKQLSDSFEESKRAEIERCKSRLSELSKETQECENSLLQRSKFLAQIKEISAEADDITSRATELNNADFARQKKSRTKVREIEAEKYELQTKINAYIADIKKIKALGPSCTSCKQDIPQEHSASLISALDAEEKVSSGRLRVISAELVSIEQDNALKTKESTAQVNELLSFRKMKEEAIRLLRESLVRLDSQEKLLSRAKEEAQRIQEDIVRISSKSANFADLINAKTSRKQECEAKILSISDEINKLNAELELCSFWVEGFSPAGLRSFMLDYVTPILNDRAAYYAQLLTGDEMEVEFTTKTMLKGGDTRDKFQILVKQKHGGDLYKGTSTGERARADLVISLALGDLAAFRTAKQLPWRFLDEPFESIDDAGTDAIVRLLNDQKARYKTVFVITHKSSFKQMFTQQITVVKENGISRLENETRDD